MEEEEDPELAPPQRDIKITTSDTTGIAENHMQTSRTVLTHKAVEKDAYEVWQREQTMPSGPGPPAGHVKGEGNVQAQGSSLESEGCEPHTRRLSAGIQCQNVSAFSWLEDQQGLSEGWKRLQLHPWREHAQVCLRSVPARRQQTETARCSAGPTPAYPSLRAGFLLQPGLFLHRFSLERKPPLPTRVHIHGGN